MDYEIENIEDGILAALRGYVQMPAEVRTIESYHGQIEDLVRDADDGSLPTDVDLSAILVCYAGSKFSEDISAEEQYFAIACVSENLRGRDDVKAGMYQILTAIKKCLKGNSLGLDIQPLLPVSIELRLSLKSVSIFNFVFKTFFAIS